MALNRSSYNPIVPDAPKPKPKKGAGVFAFLILVLGAVIAVALIPNVRSRLKGLFPQSVNPELSFGVKVWAIKRAGAYYCTGSLLYGKGSGTYLKQGDALTMGYQPAMGGYCSKSQSNDSKAVRNQKSASRVPSPVADAPSYRSSSTLTR